MSDDAIKLSMEMIASMMVYDITQREGKSPDDIIYDFMKSKSAEALFDKETGMWMNGPDYLYDYYRQERRT